MTKDFEAFAAVNRELCDLQSAVNNLSWDQETMMPPKGAPFRARQISTIAAVHHQKLTHPDVEELIERLETEDLDDWQRSSVREARRNYDKAVKLPSSLVRELAETTSLGYEAWVQARQRSDFASFAPWLEKIFALKRQQAQCLRKSDSGEDGLYEALMDEYEPDTSCHRIDTLFSQVQPHLTSLVQRIQSSANTPPEDALKGHFPRPQQEALGREVLNAMAFDWQAGRLDTSPHPFCCGISPGDVRITTRYSEEDFSSSFFGMVHEAGHALYEQGLNTAYFGLPAAEPISLGIHESQSRLWENFLARSRDFWVHWLPHLKATFPGELDDTPLDAFVHAINRVQPSFIRVDADEVTYGLHVILRYEIEKELIGGSLETAHVEEVWNQKMEDFLGIRPTRSADGALQDTHWSQGLIGYFPTYLLGTLYSAQIFAAAGEAIADFRGQIRRGEMSSLREWLRENLHQKGKTIHAEEFIENVSGQGLNPQFFLDYLERKYTELYAL